MSAMLPALRQPTRTSALRISQRVRCLATEATLPKLPSLPTVKRKEIPEGPLRPHSNIDVNPKHGLWGFFRKKLDKDGKEVYETLQPRNPAEDYSGMTY